MKRAFLISLAVALTCCVTPFTANAAYVSAPEIGDSLATSSIVESVYAERVAYLVNQQRKRIPTFVKHLEKRHHGFVCHHP